MNKMKSFLAAIATGLFLCAPQAAEAAAAPQTSEPPVLMVDGTGMCGCCRVQVGEETKFACVDGPEFDGHLVDFRGLMERGRMYRAQEAQAKDHICNIGLGRD